MDTVGGLAADTGHNADTAADKDHIQDTAGNIVGIAFAAAGTIVQQGGPGVEQLQQVGFALPDQKKQQE